MWAFHRYFFQFLFFGKTRQGLLFLALAGLFLSSFALCVVQGVMGGLQQGLVARSKMHHGVGVILFTTEDAALGESALASEATSRGLSFVRELEVELLIRQGGHVAPLVLHGIDLRSQLPPFLKDKDTSGLVLGADIGQKLKATFYSDVGLISPGTTEALMGEIPRTLDASISDFVLSDVAEIDGAHAWGRLGLVQNLLRSRTVNRWRFFDPAQFAATAEWLARREGILARSWEEQNSTLVWALNLETRVMLALFISMALLVSLAITTGLLLFFARIRSDLASFWILGFSMQRLQRLSLGFIVQLSGFTCLLGVLSGTGLLWVIARFGSDLMPDIFVERSLPVQFSALSIGLSFVIPFLIASVFSLISFAQFRRENQTFIHLVRGSGQAS